MTRPNLTLISAPPPDVRRDAKLMLTAAMSIRSLSVELDQARDKDGAAQALSDLGTHIRTAMRLWVDMTVKMEMARFEEPKSFKEIADYIEKNL